MSSDWSDQLTVDGITLQFQDSVQPLHLQLSLILRPFPSLVFNQDTPHPTVTILILCRWVHSVVKNRRYVDAALQMQWLPALNQTDLQERA